MAFPVSSRATGTLITESIWNSDIVDNLNYFKGLAGPVLIQESISLSAGKSVTADKMYAGICRYTVHKGTVREVVYNFESGDNLGGGSGGGGNQGLAGTGNYYLLIDDDVDGSNAYICQGAEVGGSKDTSWNVSRNPYYRIEFCIDSVKACQIAFLGFRRTPSGNVPPSNEVHAGLWLNNSTWFVGTGDGESATSPISNQPAANQRHVLEIIITSGVNVKFYIDGVLEATMTSNIPTGDLEWGGLLYSEGTGGEGEHSFLTIGKNIVQESLA